MSYQKWLLTLLAASLGLASIAWADVLRCSRSAANTFHCDLGWSDGRGEGGAAASPVVASKGARDETQGRVVADNSAMNFMGRAEGASYFDSVGRWVGPGIVITADHGISSTNGYFSGNVGIGTAAPGAKLDAVIGTPGINDQTSWGQSNFRFAADLNSSANQFAVNINTQTNVATGAASSYEKGALIAWARTSDPTTDPINAFHDIVGADLRGAIAAGNPSGRAWGLNTWGYVEPGADGLSVSAELDSYNGGSDQANVDTTTSKYGLLIVNLHNPSTAAINIDASGGYWHKGLYAKSASLGAAPGDSFIELSGTNPFVVTPNGKVGIGTATPNAALDVRGTISATLATLKANKAAPAACDAANEGLLAYTGGTTHYVCFCNGTSWVKMESSVTACTW